MPFRDVTLPDGEVVRARVTDEAIADWLRDRAWLRQQDRPDRPPDWDDGPARGWLPHVDTERRTHPYWKGTLAQVNDLGPASDAVSEMPLLTFVWNTGALLVKYNVTERGDGSFRITWRSHTVIVITSGETTFPPGTLIHDYEWLTEPDHPIDDLGQHVDDQVAAIDAVVTLTTGEPVVPLFTIGLVDGHDDEHDAARADVVAEYGWAAWAEVMLGEEPTKPLDSMAARA